MRQMELTSHKTLFEKHIKNLSRDSYTILSNQLNEPVLIESEQEILLKEKRLIEGKINGTYRQDRSANSKVLYHAYSGCYSNVLTECIKDNPLVLTILDQYFKGEDYTLAAEVFWINQGGMAIPPHQDRSYDSERQLSIIIPLTLNIDTKYAMRYSNISEGTILDHNFSLSNMVYYAKSIQQYPFAVNYNPTDIILHTEYSLHKSRSMPRDGRRITYSRYVAKRDK